MQIDNLGDRLRFSTYSSRMLDDPAGIAEELRVSAREQGIKFDTIVGRGSSGMLIVPIVARILRKKWLIVRKDEDVKSSHDQSCRWMGELGKRWIFLDDFSSSGRTFRIVRDGVRAAVDAARAAYSVPHFETELVGYFEYESRNDHARNLMPWREGAHPGYNDKYMGDAPWVIAQKQAEMDAMAEKMSRDITDASGTLIGTIESDENGTPYVRPLVEPTEEVAAQLSAYGQVKTDLWKPPVNAPTAECMVNLPGCKCLVPSSLEQALDQVIADKPNGETVEISTWSSTTPERYATQVETYVNAQPNVIVRNVR